MHNIAEGAANFAKNGLSIQSLLRTALPESCTRALVKQSDSLCSLKINIHCCSFGTIAKYIECQGHEFRQVWFSLKIHSEAPNLPH